MGTSSCLTKPKFHMIFDHVLIHERSSSLNGRYMQYWCIQCFHSLCDTLSVSYWWEIRILQLFFHCQSRRYSLFSLEISISAKSFHFCQPRASVCLHCGFLFSWSQSTRLWPSRSWRDDKINHIILMTWRNQLNEIEKSQ